MCLSARREGRSKIATYIPVGSMRLLNGGNRPISDPQYDAPLGTGRPGTAASDPTRWSLEAIVTRTVAVRLP
jgi:hypothetical protein